MPTSKEVSIKDLPFPKAYFVRKKNIDPQFAKMLILCSIN